MGMQLLVTRPKVARVGREESGRHRCSTDVAGKYDSPSAGDMYWSSVADSRAEVTECPVKRPVWAPLLMSRP
jgi:hypothetical protein